MILVALVGVARDSAHHRQDIAARSHADIIRESLDGAKTTGVVLG
jgi:hypothetical protein